jgi:hypothetical protein
VSAAERGWLCRPDDGSVRVEAAVDAGALILCFWRCEDRARALEAALRELGLAVVCQASGPCAHDARAEDS